jgi:hypothetical protein
VGDGVTRVAKAGILQRRTPDAVRGRVYAASESGLTFAYMTGFLLAGPTIAAFGAQATYAAGGVAALGAAALSSTVIAAARRDPVEAVRVEASKPPQNRA